MNNSNRIRLHQQAPSHPANKGWRKVSLKGNRRGGEVHDNLSDENGLAVVASSCDGRELSVESVKEFHESKAKDFKKTHQWFQMPFSSYDIQEKMMKCIQEGLQSKGKLAKPLIVTEVPTGCGKTLALLCSVLQFQLAVRQLPCREQLRFFKEQQPKHFNLSHSPCEKIQEFSEGGEDISQKVRKGKPKKKERNIPKRKESEEINEEESSWAADSEFVVYFQRLHGASEAKRRKNMVEPDLGKTSALRKQFSRPPCTIFYATRTHGQLQQVTKELRNIIGSPGTPSTPTCSTCCSPSFSSSHHRRSSHLRMNILASRDRYCIHTLVNQMKVHGNLPHEGNNLGEICDKLVTLSQCPCVENYDLLGCRAIDGQGIGTKKGDCVWDIEDLVMEGVAMQKCPYYASRDIVFYADINLCTYLYLLDPVIRHECHFEGAIKNNSIIVLDEAHNVPEVCEAVLSTQCSQEFFFEMKECLEAFIFPSEGSTAVLSYPREFRLSDGSTLLDIFSLLHSLLSAISSYFSEVLPSSSGFSRSLDSGTSVSGKKYTSASELVNRIADSLTTLRCSTASSISCDKTNPISKNSGNWRIRFRKLYGIILSIGVTFNPFNFPLHLLATLKRWLVVLRFLFQKPEAFALRAQHCSSRDVEVAEDREVSTVVALRPTSKNIECEVRCLDGSLAFSHLMRSAFRIILSSGTLTPFSQLSRSLGVPLRLWCCLEGDHVVPKENYGVHVLTKTFPHQYPLRCTYSSLSSDSFLEELGETILYIACKSLRKGGVVLMVPNYQVLCRLCQKIKFILNKYWQMPLQTNDRGYLSRLLPSRVFQEPRQSIDLRDVLDEFKSATIRDVAVFLGVYRGKSGEGLNYSDDMARMVFCLGVPFRPVTSWAVNAKRNYCGEAWYAEDALCAVNQALGRCLRHSKDFGAMILLDDRYKEEKAYQSNLSRWCRKVLVINDSAVLLAESLEKRFEVWSQLLGVEAERQKECEGPFRILQSVTGRTKDGLLLRSQEEENACALGVISGKKEWKKGCTVSDVAFAAPNQLFRKRHRDQVKEEDLSESVSRVNEHVFRCTAIKLLYEQCSDTKDVTHAALKVGASMLESNFLLDFHD